MPTYNRLVFRINFLNSSIFPVKMYTNFTCNLLTKYIMKTKLNFSNIPKGILILLLFSQLFYTACTRDELKAPGPIEQNIEQTTEQEVLPVDVHLEYTKESLNFNQFKTRLSQISTTAGIEGKSPEDLSFILESGYVQAIDTKRITEFTKDSLSTFTFNVITSDENATSFTNLIYIVVNEEISYGLVKYIPSQEWIDAKKNGEDIPFMGEINIIDDYGNELGSQNAGDGNDQAGTTIGSRMGCSFTAEPIIQECYGSACPCPDGNGLIIGWNFNISCTGWGGGSGGGGGGGTGGGGGGSGGGSGGGGTGMDLPTDPLEWALFMNIHNISGPNDFFYIDNTIDPNQAVHFNTFQDFENDLLGFQLDEVLVIDNQDDTYTTHYSFETGLANVNVFARQTLKDVANNENYLVHSVVTSLSGFTIGKAWELTQYNISLDQANNKATIDLYGILTYDSYISEIGIFYRRFLHLTLDINMLTGQSMGVAISEN